jgi:hypothetical protein
MNRPHAEVRTWEYEILEGQNCLIGLQQSPVAAALLDDYPLSYFELPTVQSITCIVLQPVMPSRSYSLGIKLKHMEH